MRIPFCCLVVLASMLTIPVSAQGKALGADKFAQDKIVFGSNDFHLYCVTTEGKIAWQCKTKEKVHGTPAVVGNRVLFGGCDQALHVVDLDKGQEVLTIALN